MSHYDNEYDDNGVDPSAERMNKPLDWDPKKTTPFDPFKNWDNVFYGISPEEYERRMQECYSGGCNHDHPLQKGVPKG